MAGTTTTIRNGLVQALAAIDGLRVADHLPEAITPPMAVVQLSAVRYHRAMSGGLSEWEFVVSLVAGRMADRAAQLQLDEWVDYSGGASIRAAVEHDRTLGGSCHTLIVAEMVAVRPLTVGDLAYLSAEWNVTVHA